MHSLILNCSNNGDRRFIIFLYQKRNCRKAEIGDVLHDTCTCADTRHFTFSKVLVVCRKAILLFCSGVCNIYEQIKFISLTKAMKKAKKCWIIVLYHVRYT